MAVDMEKIRRMRFEVTTTGAAEAQIQMDRLAAAQGNVAAGASRVSSETKKSEGALLSIAGQVDRYTKSNDNASKALDALVRGEQLRDLAISRGLPVTEGMTRALANAEARYKSLAGASNDNARAMNVHGASIGVTANQLQNLGFQLNDVVSGIAMGQRPMQILAQQGGQVYQALSMGPQGVGGSLRAIGSMIMPYLVNPLTLAAGAIGVTALAWRSYTVEQEAARRSLEGIGRASGLTLSGLNRMAGNVDGMSHGAALSALGGYAQAGLGGDMMTKLTGLSKQYAMAAGTNVTDANKKLAEAFADPVRGADSLNKQFGFLNDSSRRMIEGLANSGRTADAQVVFYNRLRDAIKGANTEQDVFGRAWDATRRGAAALVEGTVNGVGNFISPTYESELTKAATRAKTGFRGPYAQEFNLQSEYASEALRRRQQAASTGARDLYLDNLSLSAGPGVRSLTGQDQLQALIEKRDKLQAAVTGGAKFADGVDPLTGAIIKGATLADKALDAVKQSVATTMTAEDRLRKSGDLAVQGIMARTLAEKAGIAQAQVRLDMAGKEISTTQRKLTEQNALNRVMAEGNRLLQDATRAANDRAGLVGLDPLARALKENDYKYRDLREQTSGLPGSASLPGAAINATGLNSAFSAAIQKLIAEFPSVKMTSGYRSVEDQQRLWDDRANNPYPVARPGHSDHGRGIAADLSIPGGIRSDVVARAAELGMVFPLKNDPVHAVFKGGAGQQAMQDIQSQVRNGGVNTPYAKDRNSILDEAMGVDLKRQSDELDRQNQLWKIRAGMVGQGDDAIDRAVKMQELLNEAARKGITVTNVGTEAYARYTMGLSALADKSMAAEKMQKELQRTVQQMDLLRDVSKGALSSFTGDLIAGKSAAEALQHSLQGVLSKLLDMAENQLIASLFGKTGGLGGGLLGSLLGFGGGVGAPMSILPSAYGNVFGYGGVHAFADGDVFTNSIVNRPTLFPFANGTGLMGEAGPEAIMPLRRGPDGRLGVSGGNGGGGGTTVIVNNNADGTKATATKDSNGNTTINIDTMVEAIEGRMASRVSRGRGPFAPILRTPKIG